MIVRHVLSQGIKINAQNVLIISFIWMEQQQKEAIVFFLRTVQLVKIVKNQLNFLIVALREYDNAAYNINQCMNECPDKYIKDDTNFCIECILKSI